MPSKKYVSTTGKQDVEYFERLEGFRKTREKELHSRDQNVFKLAILIKLPIVKFVFLYVIRCQQSIPRISTLNAADKLKMGTIFIIRHSNSENLDENSISFIAGSEKRQTAAQYSRSIEISLHLTRLRIVRNAISKDRSYKRIHCGIQFTV